MRLHHRKSTRKRLKRFLLLLLALAFLLEAWLWETTGLLIALAIRIIPFERYKQQFARYISSFSPWLTLGLFGIPFLVLLPLKFTAVWLLAEGYVFGGLSMILVAKLVGLGVTSFLFTLCKPKLLQLRGVRWLYGHCVRIRARAALMVAPYTRYVARLMRRIKRRFPRSKLLVKLRQRMHNARQSLKTP